jgi:hypothetical protein
MGAVITGTDQKNQSDLNGLIDPLSTDPLINLAAGGIWKRIVPTATKTKDLINMLLLDPKENHPQTGNVGISLQLEKIVSLYSNLQSE